MKNKNNLTCPEHHRAIMAATPFASLREGRMVCDLYINDPLLRDGSDVAVYSVPIMQSVRDFIGFSGVDDLDGDKDASDKAAVMIEDLKLMIATLETEFPQTAD